MKPLAKPVPFSAPKKFSMPSRKVVIPVSVPVALPAALVAPSVVAPVDVAVPVAVPVAVAVAVPVAAPIEVPEVPVAAPVVAVTESILTTPSVLAAVEKEAATMDFQDLISSAGSLIHQGGAQTQMALHMLAARAFGPFTSEEEVEDAGEITQAHKVVYEQISKKLGDKYYYTTFATLAKEFGAEHFPLSWVFVANSHPDSEFMQNFGENDSDGDDDDDRHDKPQLKDFQKANQRGLSSFDEAALWMITENWVPNTDARGRVTKIHATKESLQTVEQMRKRLYDDSLSPSLLTDEEVQMLIDFVQVDPNPYWMHGPVQRVAEPVVEPVPEPVVELIAEPVVERVAEPVVERIAEPVIVPDKEKMILRGMSDADLYYLLNFLGNLGINNNAADLIFQELIDRHPGGTIEKINHQDFLEFTDVGKDWKNCYSRPGIESDEDLFLKVNPVLKDVVTLLNFFWPSTLLDLFYPKPT